MLITTYAFWLLLGVALLLSELFVFGLIAAFFGVGALVVGGLTLLGWVETLPMQLALFLIVSLAVLVILRKHCQRWLRGAEGGRSVADLDDAGVVGARVTVLTDFANGVGTVKLRGAQWSAESIEPSMVLKAGEPAWVVEHKGIVLLVSALNPDSTP